MQTIPFDKITVARPCKVSWDSMHGDERVRFCEHCQSKVFNLSEMNREQAERLVRDHLGKMCARFYRRPDGTVSTKSCGQTMSRMVRWALGGAVLTLGIFSLLIVGIFARSRDEDAGGMRARITSPIQYILNWLNPPPPPVVMGDICVPNVPPPVPPINDPANPEERPGE